MSPTRTPGPRRLVLARETVRALTDLLSPTNPTIAPSPEVSSCGMECPGCFPDTITG